jgi:WD40 repeat protein
VWDVDTCAELARLPLGAAALSICFHPQEPRLFTGTREGGVHVWDVGTSDRLVELLRIPAHESYVKSLEWSPDGEILVSSSGDSTVGLWDATTTVERLDARDARRELVARLEPRLDELLAGADGDEAVRALLERSALGADERRIAYQLYLARAWAALR